MTPSSPSVSDPQRSASEANSLSLSQKVTSVVDKSLSSLLGGGGEGDKGVDAAEQRRDHAQSSTVLTPAPLPALPIEMSTLTGRSDGADLSDRSDGRRESEEDEEDGHPAALMELTGGYTPYLGRMTAVACLGGLQFGWDTGVAAGMLVAIREDLGHPLSAAEQEIIVSATTVGAILGALTAGRLSDWIGRKKVMIIAGIFFALGSIEQAASQVVRELVLGRLLVGLGVGMASMVVPTYLGECAPPSIRGRIVGINSLLITGGQVIAYAVDAAFYNLPHGWRWMVLAGGLPALIQLVGLFYLDESPRWLISRGRHVAARHVLQRIYPLADEAIITTQVNKIERSLGKDSTSDQTPSTIEHANSFKMQMHRLWYERPNRKALFLACGLQAGQQLIGANSILYYSSRLLLMAGFQTNPNVAAVWVAVANFIGTVIAMRLVDRVGRRTLLLHATAAATVSLALLALALGQIKTGDVSGGAPSSVGGGGAWPYICLIAMAFFLFFYALGLGTVPWLVQSEIFSGTVRGVGGGLATATNWSMNLLTSATFLDLVRLITPAGSFCLYTVVGVLTWTFTYTQLPELMGVSINDVHATLESDGARGANANGGYAPVRGRDFDEERWSSESGQDRDLQ